MSAVSSLFDSRQQELGACEKCGAALCELRDALWYHIRTESARVRAADGPRNILQHLLFEHFKARHVVGVDSEEEKSQGETGGETAGSEYESSTTQSTTWSRSSMRDILSGMSRAAASSKVKMRRMHRQRRRNGSVGVGDEDDSSSDDDARMNRHTARSGIRSAKPPVREQRVIRARETFDPDDYD